MDEIQKQQTNASVVDSLTNAIEVIEQTDAPNKYEAIIKMVDKIVEVTDKIKAV